MNNAKQIVREFLHAVQGGDNQTVAALLHPEVTWEQPGHNRFAGTRHSANEVFQMIGGMYEVTQNSLSLADILFVGDNESEVACLLHFKASRTGLSLDSKNIDVYTVKDGKIIQVRVFVDDPAHEDAFWGQTETENEISATN